MTTAVLIVTLVILIFAILQLKPLREQILPSPQHRAKEPSQPAKASKPQAAIRGKVGESTVNHLLTTLPSPVYATYSNLYVPSPMSKKRPSSEVDHIVVSRYGIFVIETKNYSGEIDANETWKNWYYSGTRVWFPNPIWQNKRHVDDLRDFLELKSSQFHSLIFFVNRNPFKHGIPPKVHNRAFLQQITNKREPSLTVTQVEQVKAKLQELEEPSYRELAAKKHEAHIAKYKPEESTNPRD